MTWTWQDPIVALIVAYAVVALYRHLRALIGSAAPASKAQGSCHGCDDGCATDDVAPSRTAPPPNGAPAARQLPGALSTASAPNPVPGRTNTADPPVHASAVRVASRSR